VESFPAETVAILEAGHEVAHHSYAPVDPSTQTATEERADMERAWEALERVGVRPLGFRSPSADLFEATSPRWLARNPSSVSGGVLASTGSTWQRSGSCRSEKCGWEVAGRLTPADWKELAIPVEKEGGWPLPADCRAGPLDWPPVDSLARV
jgi:peptidoglycan/xylan/chitin deacetylase (PgdA/CDA1 family)